jgi:hypothetical protein
MADKLSVADLLGRNIAIEWFEGVSLVREVCTVLGAERVRESTPEVNQIFLSATGKITITGTAHTDAPVRRLGQLLQACLLRAGDAPVTLRLVLSEAMAAPPVYDSIADLDAALAYFERPDRQSVLRSLYDRAVEAPAVSPDSAEVRDLDEIAPLPAVKTEAKKTPRKPANRRALALVAAGALLVSALAVAHQRGLLFRGQSLKAVGNKASAAVDNAVFSGVSAVTEMAGMGKLVPPGGESADVPVPVKAALPSTSRRIFHPPAIMLAGLPVKLFDIQPAAADPAQVADAPDAATPAVLEASALPLAPDVKVYGPEDRDVVAPQAIRPHLPSTLPEGTTASQLARIELTVAPDGLVETVKLLPGSRPVNVPEAMLLSAAKTWRFSPAVREGRNVRYRKTVLLSEK